MTVFEQFNSALPRAPICDNLNLAFNHYLAWKERAGEWKADVAGLVEKWKLNCANATNPLKNVLSDYASRRQAVVRDLGYEVCQGTLTTRSRLVVGLGNPNPSENGLTFHHVYGFPIIPGSAQKGLCAHYAKELEGKTESDTEYQEVFGNTKQKGRVIFLNAFPLLINGALPPGLLELDIMNPHYQEYYSNKGGTPPADYLSPNPIFFLAVGSRLPFSFTLMADGQHKDSLDRAWGWLKSGLCIVGIGGKTQVGYGRLS